MEPTIIGLCRGYIGFDYLGTSVVSLFPFLCWGLLIKADHQEKGYPYH